MSQDTRRCETCGSEVRKYPGPGRWPRFCKPCAAARKAAYKTKWERPEGYIPPSRRGSCSECGKAVQLSHTSASVVRCLECRRASRPGMKPCEFCGESFEPKRRGAGRWTATCSKSCAAKLHLKNGEHAWQVAPRYGVWTDGGDPERERDRYRRRDYRRRMRLAQVEAEPYTAAEIFERDGWRCGECRRTVRADLAWPHPRSASVDHIVPLSLGGEDTRANVRLAHLDCNTRRGNRVEWGQQLLIG